MVFGERVFVESGGDCDILDVTGEVAEVVERSGVREGAVLVFVVGSTAAMTTIEYEPGLVKVDIRAALEKISPEDGYYAHEATWGDDNGHAHVRATLVGPSLTVPIVDGGLTLGRWQQIVLVDFDTRARRREIVCQVFGEA